jgi:hypothetical protein
MDDVATTAMNDGRPHPFERAMIRARLPLDYVVLQIAEAEQKKRDALHALMPAEVPLL